jgi:hypothetical protein
MRAELALKAECFQWINPFDNKLALAEPRRHFSTRILELSEMAGHPLKNLVVTLGVNAAIAVGCSLGAHAFTETNSAPATQAAPAPGLQLKTPDDGSGLALTSPGDAKADTELNIPGIGSVGSLPKLDFGLELLYGAGGSPASEKPLDDKNDDVLIKGTIKHRF